MTPRAPVFFFTIAVLEAAGAAANAEPRRGESGEQSGERIVVTPRSGAPEELVSGDSEALDAGRGLREPGFVTVIHPAASAGEEATVAEVVARSQGVEVRSLGGLGSFSAISVRGASAGHTAVVVDGVPLSKLSSAAQDLGALDLRSYGELELYRSGAPATIPGAGLGGALLLSSGVGPVERPLWLAVGAGSFGARELRIRHLGGSRDGSIGTHASASYAASRGDYRYFNDHGTRLNPGDDTVDVRANNDSRRGDLVGRLRRRSDTGSLEVGARLAALEQGIPGASHSPTAEARLATVQPIFDVGGRSALGSAVLEAGLFASAEWLRYRDPLDEVGLEAEDRRSLSTVVGGRAKSAWALPGNQRLALGLDFELDRYSEDERRGTELADSVGRRAALGLAADDEILVAKGRWILRPAVRIDGVRTEPTSTRYEPERIPETRSEWLPSPRLASLVFLREDVTLKGSGGRYARLPTLLELFGDRGYVLGNPELQPESGFSGDLGVVFAPGSAGHGVDRLHAEVAGFALRPRHAIVFAAQNGLVSRARNLEGADIRGLETALSLRLWRTLTVAGNYTLTGSRVRSSEVLAGNRLPQRPRHRLYGRAELARRWLDRLAVLWGEVSVASGTFLDEANLYELPARTLASAGLKHELGRGLLLGLEVANLSDERVEYLALRPPPSPELASVPRAVSDYFGYPLPGRAFYARLEWTPNL